MDLRWRVNAIVCLACTTLVAQQPDEILRRMSEEAEVFAANARDVVATETLTHREAKPPSRFRPRVGTAVMERPKIRYETREMVSEYGYGALAESPAVLHEFRQIVSVDGRRVLTAEKARRTLSLGLKSRDDHVKKQILKDFEKQGITRGATDFGQVLLLFTKRRLGGYRFAMKGDGMIGADPVVIVGYEETTSQSLTVFEGNQMSRAPMRGEIHARKPDFLPLRVTMSVERKQRDGLPVRTEAVVDYTPSPHGILTPASVIHREFAKGELITENLFRYSPFKKFGAEAELKFDVDEK